jgi:capsular polysaccharide biosynthesis protein
LSSEEVRSGATISTVKTSTYLFGLIAGALVGLLIALQLTLIDKRVRSLSQLSKRFEARALLGTVTDDETSIQHVAAAIVARAQTLSLASISLVPVDEHTDAQSLAERIHAVASSMGVTVASLANISMLSANELISSHSGMIALASRGVSLTEDIVTTWSVLESAQKPMLGVILTDSTI